MRLIVLHGIYSSPQRNWFPWLKAQAQRENVAVHIPQLPQGAQQTPQNWKQALHAAVGALAPTDILIGHSLGAAFLLHLLQEAHTPVRAAFFVAGFARSLNLGKRQDLLAGEPEIAGADAIIDSFAQHPFDWERIRSHRGAACVYQGEGDPYVTLQHGEELAAHLQVPLQVIPNGKHLNQDAGYTQFPRLWEDLQPLLGP